MLHFWKDWWKFIQIQQYYTIMALTLKSFLTLQLPESVQEVPRPAEPEGRRRRDGVPQGAPLPPGLHQEDRQLPAAEGGDLVPPDNRPPQHVLPGLQGAQQGPRRPVAETQGAPHHLRGGREQDPQQSVRIPELLRRLLGPVA